MARRGIYVDASEVRDLAIDLSKAPRRLKKAAGDLFDNETHALHSGHWRSFAPRPSGSGTTSAGKGRPKSAHSGFPGRSARLFLDPSSRVWIGSRALDREGRPQAAPGRVGRSQTPPRRREAAL